MPKLVIVLNGTDENPYHKMGLKQNPFPQLGKAETDGFERQLNKLGADPIPQKGHKKYIREVLAGFSEELVDLCIRRYEPGQMITFEVEWDK